MAEMFYSFWGDDYVSILCVEKCESGYEVSRRFIRGFLRVVCSFLVNSRTHAYLTASTDPLHNSSLTKDPGPDLGSQGPGKVVADSQNPVALSRTF